MTIRPTQEQTTKYLEKKGKQCIFCESTEIEADSTIDIAGGKAYQHVSCHNCKKEWDDEYTLTGIGQPSTA